MGSEKSSAGTTNVTTQQSTPTAEETALNQLQLGQAQAMDPMQRQINQSGGTLINQLLTGQQLPGYLNTLPGGIDENTTQGIVNQSLRDVYSQGNVQGIGDSGTMQSVAARTAGDIRLSAQEFNLQNLMQLLNLASGQAAQNQNIAGSTVNSLGSRLAGLRSTTGTSTGTQTTTSMNPFLKSFQTSFGSSLGKGASAGVTSFFA
jgi:DNA-binding CsgD family transcriptional regulator